MQAARSVRSPARCCLCRCFSSAAAAKKTAVRPKMNAQETAAALRRANAVCFDVDSTVITTEGIDELGAFLGKAEEVRSRSAPPPPSATPRRVAHCLCMVYFNARVGGCLMHDAVV